jgi:hypothetical protein
MRSNYLKIEFKSTIKERKYAEKLLKMKMEEFWWIKADIICIQEMIRNESNNFKITFQIKVKQFNTGDAYLVKTDENGEIQEKHLRLHGFNPKILSFSIS